MRNKKIIKEEENRRLEEERDMYVFLFTNFVSNFTLGKIWMTVKKRKIITRM